MKTTKLLTNNNMVDNSNKDLYFFDSGRLMVSNLISPDFLDFFYEYYGNLFTEIVYYESNRPICSNCNIPMNNNGSRVAKPNKLEGIRKKQYICPNCGKTHSTSLEKFIKRFSNFTISICEKSVQYGCIDYLSYQKKAEND